MFSLNRSACGSSSDALASFKSSYAWFFACEKSIWYVYCDARHAPNRRRTCKWHWTVADCWRYACCKQTSSICRGYISVSELYDDSCLFWLSFALFRTTHKSFKWFGSSACIAFHLFATNSYPSQTKARKKIYLSTNRHHNRTRTVSRSVVRPN